MRGSVFVSLIDAPPNFLDNCGKVLDKQQIAKTIGMIAFYYPLQYSYKANLLIEGAGIDE